MNEGTTATITLHGTVASTGSLSNTATVSADQPDGLQTNNTSTAVASAVTDIPAISDLGLVLLGLMLAFAGAVVARRT